MDVFLEKKAAQIRLDALTAIHKSGCGYAGSVMSVVDILVALYYGSLSGSPILNCDSKNPDFDGQDYLVLSKGHAVIAQYAILADLGFFDKSELNYFGKQGSLLSNRPYLKVPGITVSNISHGQGLSMALGIALSLKMDKRNNKVFAVLGDGELQEGQVWEAAMAASHYKLDNLVAIVDNNKVQAEGNVSAIMDIGCIQDKFEAFGWRVVQVTDGHDFDKLLDAFRRAESNIRRPVLIWCHTVCGKGMVFAEGKQEYRDAFITERELNEIISNLKETV
ncbi:transketolase [Candidatus Peregrinibacteria bacterium]|nr:transketolase [Candidatus Peregrinibacteria bacterium]